MMRPVLAFIGRHPVAIPAVACVAGVIIVALNPGDPWSWLVGVTGATWLGLTIIRTRRGGR